jgi:hypothetical protein
VSNECWSAPAADAAVGQSLDAVPHGAAEKTEAVECGTEQRGVVLRSVETVVPTCIGFDLRMDGGSVGRLDSKETRGTCIVYIELLLRT